LCSYKTRILNQMIQLGTILKITDKTGVVLGQCIKVLNVRNHRIAGIGDVILISVKWVNVKRLALAKARIQKRYKIGTMHRAMIIRTRTNYQIMAGVHVRFNENAAIIVSKKRIALSNRVYGPVLRNMCLRYPWLGCISRLIV